MPSNHKYRVGVYLGKDLYEQLTTIADMYQMPLATLVKILLNTGIEMSKTMNHVDSPWPLEEEIKENGK